MMSRTVCAGPVAPMSAAYPEPQVQYPVALDDQVGILQQERTAAAAEVAFARPEHHRHHVHRHLVHEPGREDLAAHLASVHGDDPLPGELLGLADRSCH